MEISEKRGRTCKKHTIMLCSVLYEIKNGCTSGLTGSSMPTTQMQVRSDRMSFSLSQSGSGLLGKSLKATQMVLSPSQAMGSITFFTISSLSRGLKMRGSPAALRILEHLDWARKRE